MQIERQDFIVRKIIADEPDEELDLEDDLFIDIDEPVVYASDPCIRLAPDDEDAGEKDAGGPEAEKKESGDD